MTKPVRQSNFELLRLVCMMMVLICNANYGEEGWPTQALINELPFLYLWRVLVNQFCLVSVPVFVMISGWFGIRPSVKGFCNLMFQVFFAGAVCAVVVFATGQDINMAQVVLSLFGAGHWFVASYVVLYVLAPLLNAFVEQAEERQLRYMLLVYFAVEFVYGFISEAGFFYRGYSALHFIGLYLLARYLRLHPNRFTGQSSATDFLIYFLISLLTGLLFYFGTGWRDVGFHLIWIISPFVTVASAFFLLAFSKLSFQSRVINWMASSAFAIYLYQENVLIRPYFKSVANAILSQNGFWAGVVELFLFLCCVAVLCILVDKLRQAIWRVFAKEIR